MNFSVIISQQIVFVPLLLIKLLSSTKTIVPFVLNTSLWTRAGEEWKFHRRGTKSSKWAKGRMDQKRLGTTGL